MVPPAGLEPARPAPEAGALSAELRGLARSPAGMLSAADGCQQPDTLLTGLQSFRHPLGGAHCLMEDASIPFRESGGIRALCEDMLSERQLIIASNRGPIEFQVEGDGSLSSQRGGGGVATALTAAGRLVPATWVASAMSEGDRRAAAESAGSIQTPDGNISVHFVVVPRPVYQRYYYVFVNPLLWFLQHYMWNTPRTPNIGRSAYEAWETGYVPVNRAFAEVIAAVAKEKPGPPYVTLHDYHLYLAVAELRKLLPEATILHFTHIPWPGGRLWGILPKFMRAAIHESMCTADIVGLQTAWDVRNFLHSCEVILPEATIDHEACSVSFRGHTTRVRHYPISVDCDGLVEFASSPEVRRYRDQLQANLTEQTVVRVDRSEPSKNIIRGLTAWEIFLERYPDFRGRVSLLQFLVPSRSELGLYQTLTDEIFELVHSINDEYGRDDWLPVRVFYENNYAQAIAGMSLYDVLMVNPLQDGMNLVSKEGPLVNKGDGVLILSELAGSHEQLGEHSISVGPMDLEGTVKALHQALTMSVEDRRRRAKELKRRIQDEDIVFWLEAQLRDLRSLAR